MTTACVCAVKVLCLSTALSPGPLLYAPLDGDARGALIPHAASLRASGQVRFVDGVVGRAAVAKDAPLSYELAPLLTRDEGTVAAWVLVPWGPKEGQTRMIFDLGKFGSVRRWQSQLYLTYTLWYHHIDEKHDYSCHASITHWRPGQWHHMAMTWSWEQKRRVLYVEGEPVDAKPIRRPANAITLFRIGPDLDAVDEVVVFPRAISHAEVRQLYAKGKAGQPALSLRALPPVCGAAAKLPNEARPADPSFVDWSFNGAWQRDNGLRGEATLNGWWRWQLATNAFAPPKAGAWLYRKAPALSSYGAAFPVRDANKATVPPAKLGMKSHHDLTGAHVWCEREFAVPANWRDRRIVLDVDSVVKGGAIYLNRELLDVLPERSVGGTYDLTERVRLDKPNLLTIRCHGIDGDLWLRALPKATRLDDAWLRTSYRKRRIECELTVTSANTCRATVEVRESEGGPVLKTVRARVPAGDARVVVAGEDWMPAKLWSLEEPNLYSFTVQLTHDSGRPVDGTFPKRFGFRELWIEGDKFLLNGLPTHFVGHSNSHMTRTSEVGCEEYLRYSFRRWKAAGLNCVTPWQGVGRNPTFSHLLRVADEMGMAIFLHNGLPSFERQPYLSDTDRAEYSSYYKRYIRRYRQHPSLLAWMVGGGSHVLDFCPSAMDGSFDPDSAPDWDRPKRVRMGWELAREHDPTRLAFGLSAGEIGPVWTSMAYLGFDVELRERRNWPWAWSRVRHKPVMPCEFSLPYYRDWFMRTQRRSGRANYAPEGTHTIATEYAAMYFGAQAYGWDDEEYLASLSKSPGAPYKARSCWETKNLFADTLLSWRTYGLSFVYHAEVPSLFTGDRPKFPHDPGRDPRCPGGAPENMHGSLQAADDLSEFGERVRAATAPVVACIAGPGRDFFYTDHTYFVGEPITKGVVVLNYRPKPLRYGLRWRAVTRGRDVTAKGKSDGLQLAPGRRSVGEHEIRFTAPTGPKREDVRIELDLTGEVTGHHAFTVTVFPRGKAVACPTLALFDPVGDTRDVLRRLGVRTEPVRSRLRPDQVLVVGRHGLEGESHREELAKWGFDEAVNEGLRVLVFEQAAPGWEGNLLGLKIRKTSTRHAFPRAPGHPCLAGLAGSDLHFFRGDSDLVEAHPKVPGFPTAYPLHFWHWGNDNIVATYVIEKPQVGAAAALVDCGFDLSEAALLEVTKGKGAMLFCQLDVTNRCPSDPVAERLVRNMLGYLASLEPRQGRGLEPAGAAKRVPVVGTVALYRSKAPGVPGISDGDLFFREKLSLPVFDSEGQTPLFKRAGGLWVTSLSLAKLNTPWQRAKLARIEAALRLANHTPTQVGPALAHHGDAAALYPIDWRRVESMKGSFDPYVYWRW